MCIMVGNEVARAQIEKQAHFGNKKQQKALTNVTYLY